MPQQAESQARHFTEWGLTVGGLGLNCAFWFSMRYAQEWVLPPLGPQRTVTFYDVDLTQRDRQYTAHFSVFGEIVHPPNTSPDALSEATSFRLQAPNGRWARLVFIDFVSDPERFRIQKVRLTYLNLQALNAAIISTWIEEVAPDLPEEHRLREASELLLHIQFLSGCMKSIPLPSFQVIEECPRMNITHAVWRRKSEPYRIWWALCGLSVIWWLRRTGWLALAGREAWNHRRQAVNTVKSALHFAYRCFVRSVRYVVRGY